MLECLSFKSSTSSSTIPNPSREDTPSVSREYNIAVNTNSYAEIRSNIHSQTHLLNPDRNSINHALTKFKTTTPLTRLISTFFDHTETASELCLHLHQCLHRARAFHAPLLDLFETLDHFNLTQNDCERALFIFRHFDTLENPIPDSHTFSNLRESLRDLKTTLDGCVSTSLSRLRISRRATAGSALCLVAAAVGVVAATVAVTVHAIVALASAVAGVPLCAFERRELSRLKQLDAAAKCAYVLSNDLGTIDALVSRLRAAAEGDRILVQLGLERGDERFIVQEVVKQLCKSHEGFLRQVEDLEEHIYLCFYNINKNHGSHSCSLISLWHAVTTAPCCCHRRCMPCHCCTPSLLLHGVTNVSCCTPLLLPYGIITPSLPLHGVVIVSGCCHRRTLLPPPHGLVTVARCCRQHYPPLPVKFHSKQLEHNPSLSLKRINVAIASDEVEEGAESGKEKDGGAKGNEKAKSMATQKERTVPTRMNNKFCIDGEG